MAEIIIVSKEEFIELIALRTKVELVEGLIKKDKYISTDAVCAIFGIEVKDNG